MASLSRMTLLAAGRHQPAAAATAVSKTADSVRTYYGYCNEPTHPLDRKPEWKSAEEAMQFVKSGQSRILIVRID